MADFNTTRLFQSPLGPTSQFAISAAVLFVATGAAVLARPWLGEGYASLLFVVGTMIIGAVSGLTRAVITALVAAAAFNFFVVAPFDQFNFESPVHIAPPLVFVLCAVVSGVLSGRLRDQTHQSWLANARLESLLSASRDLQPVGGVGDLRDVLQRYLPTQDDLTIRLYWLTNGTLQPADAGPRDPAWDDAVKAIGSNTAAGRSPRVRNEAIDDGMTVVGALVYAARKLSAEDTAYVAALARLASLALTRRRLDAEVAETRVLARSEELKSALLSSVSHDLRTPLTTIATAASSMLTFSEEIDAETRHDLLVNIVDECDRLSQLTDNLLQMGRLQAGTANLSGTVLGAQDMLRRCIARLRSQESTHDFVIEAPREDVLVMADTALFELALINILQNAAKYSAPGTTIRAMCAVDEADCIIAITDEGIGVPVAEQVRVFERFYRVGGPTHGPKGSGLGLAIAKGFVEATGGSIALASPVINGRGTTITIRLPRAQEEPLP